MMEATRGRRSEALVLAASGATVEEIAANMDITHANARQLLCRSRRDINAALENETFLEV